MIANAQFHGDNFDGDWFGVAFQELIYEFDTTHGINVWLNKDNNPQTQIEIFNIEGSLVIKQISNSNQIKINIKDLSKSVYLIKISNNNLSITKRFIKL